MKNKIILIFLIVFSFISCEKDESKNPLATIVPGNFVYLDIKNRAIDANDKANTFFSGNLTTPGNNIVKYQIFVRCVNAAGITTGNYVFYKEITSFPTELKITTAELATALNIVENDIKKSFIFRFWCYAYDKNGKVTTFNNLSSVLRSEQGLKQGYRFNTGVEDAIAIPNFDNYSSPE